ncbi:uncharacterized protein EAE97_000035 [Botrytis byssoidea]|uniref:Uncharacterized protein n=1 Tax=Botrytis byssoidea TaxID=139641 RepID=A0A9P5LZ62_9HELO|nr:uncharacterized protein EAE97_000035 [Botrytis byssoidea]KAF7954776.1 hypothetical protein EAE97_000035 [Botrytis byssoidea]
MIEVSLLFPGHPSKQLPLQGLLKDNFSSGPHEDIYVGATFEDLCFECIPEKDSLEAGFELNLPTPNPTSKKSYTVSNFVKPEPDLDLPASIFLPERHSFAAQDFIDSDEPEEPRIAFPRMQWNFLL